MKTILPKILLGLLIVITISGSIWFFSQNAVSNNSNTNNSNNSSTPSKDSSPSSSDSTKNSSTSNTVTVPDSTSTANSANTPTAPNNPNTPSTPSTPAKTSNPNNCIITISGQKYDVTELLTTHSGGNIFECGKDNTSIFFSQHNQRWLDSRVAKYKVN